MKKIISLIIPCILGSMLFASTVNAETVIEKLVYQNIPSAVIRFHINDLIPNWIGERGTVPTKSKIRPTRYIVVNMINFDIDKLPKLCGVGSDIEILVMEKFAWSNQTKIYSPFKIVTCTTDGVVIYSSPILLRK